MSGVRQAQEAQHRPVNEGRAQDAPKNPPSLYSILKTIAYFSEKGRAKRRGMVKEESSEGVWEGCGRGQRRFGL